MKSLLAGAILFLAPSIASAQFGDNFSPFVQVTSTTQETTMLFTDPDGFSDLNLNTLVIRVNGVNRTTDVFNFIAAGAASIQLVEDGFLITVPGDYRHLMIFGQIRDLTGGLRGNDTNQN